jgi:Ca2+-binding RTX toxin-like protein
MADIFQNISDALGLSDQTASASTISAPSNGSTNVAFSLQLSPGTFSGGENLFVAAPTDSTVTAPGSTSAVIVGGAGNDHLTGGSGPDVLFGGGGTNVLTGGGGTDVFGHAAGATDYITDFSHAAGEHIALQTGLTFTSSTATTVAPATVGLTGTTPIPAVALSFSDGSTVTLVNSTDHPDNTWFI